MAKSIKEAWEQYATQDRLAGKSPEHIEAMRHLFYRGAEHFLTQLMRGPNPMTHERALQVMRDVAGGMEIVRRNRERGPEDY